MSSLRQHSFHGETSAEGALTQTSPLMLDFLTWIASGPRSYAEAMEAWRTSCPRFTIWEDALDDALIRLESGRGAGHCEARVVLTPAGGLCSPRPISSPEARITYPAELVQGSCLSPFAGVAGPYQGPGLDSRSRHHDG